jgi:hypothetical protein
LFVKGRASASADPWLGHGEIYGPPRLLGPQKEEPIVLPLAQPLLDEIEKRLGLPASAPIVDERGQVLSDLRGKLAGHAQYFRDKEYLETDRPARNVVRSLNEAHAYLNRAAGRGALTTAANEARFHCAEALRLLEGGNPPHRIPTRAAEAVRNAAIALHKDDPPPGASMVQAYAGETGLPRRPSSTSRARKSANGRIFCPTLASSSAAM